MHAVFLALYAEQHKGSIHIMKIHRILWRLIVMYAKNQPFP